MIVHDHLLHQRPALGSLILGSLTAGRPVPGSPVLFKIAAGKLRDPSILKPHPKVFELIIPHIHIAHMQKPFCPGQDRGG